VNVKGLINHHGGVFPAGGRLVLEAEVMEEATGKTEDGFSDDVVFTDSPFVIDLSRSKTTFRPGMRYYLQVKKNLNKSLGAMKSVNVAYIVAMNLVSLFAFSLIEIK